MLITIEWYLSNKETLNFSSKLTTQPLTPWVIWLHRFWKPGRGQNESQNSII